MGCAFESSAGELVACGGLDNVCSIYRLRSSPSGAIAPSVSRADVVLRGHEGYLSSCRFVSSTQMLTGSGDSSCGLWDIATRERVKDFKDHGGDVLSISLNPTNPSVFCSGSIDGTAKVWDVRKKFPCTHTFVGHESDVNSVDFMPDGMVVGTGSEDASSMLFDLRAHGPLNKFSKDSAMLGVFSVCFSKSGRLLFAGNGENVCNAWDTLATDGTCFEMRGHGDRVSTVGVNSTGNALCTGSWDQTVMVWA